MLCRHAVSCSTSWQDVADCNMLCLRLPCMQARKALDRQEVPIGCVSLVPMVITPLYPADCHMRGHETMCLCRCVLVRDNVVVARGSNMTNETRNVRVLCCQALLPASGSSSVHPPLETLHACAQDTRHAEFEAIDELLGAHGSDTAQARFHEYAPIVMITM